VCPTERDSSRDLCLEPFGQLVQLARVTNKGHSHIPASSVRERFNLSTLRAHGRGSEIERETQLESTQ
jgi:hypothetical protein